MGRIDKIRIVLDVSEEFEGRHPVVFDVDPTKDPVLLAAVQAAWQRWSDDLLASLSKEVANPFDFV